MLIRKKGDYHIVCPGNELGLTQVSERLQETFSALRAKGCRRICVDLTQAPVIDSSVIGALVRCSEELRGDSGELVLISAHNPVIEALFRLQLHRLIRFVESEDQLI